MDTVRETLLQLSSDEKKERARVKVDYYYYKGACEDREKAKIDKPKLGQNWENQDNLDYEPTQDIRNKVKPLLKKQARWMFSKEPDITIVPFDTTKKELAEELRRFIDNILRKNLFWKKTRQAFLMSTIKKRVMLRASVKVGNRDVPGAINLRYEDVENFSYKEIDGVLTEARFFQEDLNNFSYEENENKKIYYIHKFTYEAIEENTPAKATYVIETYKGDNLLDPIKIVSQVIGFEENKIPAWLIKNGGELGEEFGETDLHDLKPSQDRYNKTTSDVADAIKFSLFGIESGIDLHPDDVGKFNISPGALHVARTSDEALAQGKQGNIQRQEFSLSNLSSVELYLDRIEKDMNTILDMPSLDDMNNIPSAKAMRYLYNDLVARCEEKWNDWGPVLEEVIRYIIAIAEEAKLPGFNPKWKDLDFSLIFKHNYPIPADEEERKATAINEVLADVRTRKSYITEFSSAEDAEKEFNDILAEKSLLEGSSMGEFNVNNNSDEDIELDNQNEDDDKTRDPDEE